ncbi:hypothetical protein [Nonomuraea sp. NPDC050310]|uniref:hypothetical protein n=1 Tax=Nonomuraea sp. NPDC050310 TaxID=3154935 RepID=UPI0033EB158B
MRSDDLMRQAGAVWCDRHERWECSKVSKRSSLRCHAFAVRGTPVCYNHAGKKTDTLKAQGAALEEALSAWQAEPGRVVVSPADAVMAMLQMAWARLHVYADLLRRQVESAGDSPAGLVMVLESGETVRGLARLDAEERDRAVRYAKAAHDMGIADREIRLAERQGALLAEAINRILDQLELTSAQRALVPTVVPTVLRGIAEAS